MEKNTLIDTIREVTIIAGVVTAFWKGIDAFFSYLSKKDKEFIKEVVKEAMQEQFKTIKDEIKEVHRRVDDVYKDMRK